MLKTFEVDGQIWYKLDLSDKRQQELSELLGEASFKIDEIDRAIATIFTGPAYEPSAFDFYVKLIDEKYITSKVFYSLVVEVVGYAQLEHTPDHAFGYDRALNAFTHYIPSKDKE